MATKAKTEIKIGGRTLEENSLHLSFLTIHHTLDGHHSFELRCPIYEKSNILIDAVKLCGEEITIDFYHGYADGGKNALGKFKGYVTGAGLAKNHGSTDELVFQGYAPTIKMADGAHHQSFEEKSLNAIVEEVVQQYGLRITANSIFKETIPYTVQYNENGFHFLNRIANTYGEWFFYDGEEIIFGKLPTHSDPVPLVFGVDLLSFNLAAKAIPNTFNWSSYDAETHDFPKGKAKGEKVEGLESMGKQIASISEKLFTHEPTAYIPDHSKEKNHIKSLIKSQKAGRAANHVQFFGQSDNVSLKLGSLIKITGKIADSGQSQSGEEAAYGTFRIIELSQSTDALGNYQNSFKAIPSKLIHPPNNPEVFNTNCEMQIAKVIENHDPEEMGRVRVQFPWQKPSDGKTPWIRVSASGAGSGYGTFFIPELGDQVLVGFEHNNPDKPYVIGGLYHGKSKPKEGFGQRQQLKVIQTKSGNKIAFNDTPGEEEVKIENGHNSVTLNLSGDGSITISTEGDMSLSAKNITISAKENLNLTAKTSTLEGTDSVTTKGKDATTQADMKATVKGKNVEVAADLIADIKANSMLKLNS